MGMPIRASSMIVAEGPSHGAARYPIWEVTTWAERTESSIPNPEVGRRVTCTNPPLFWRS